MTERYSRQVLFKKIGEKGQQKLGKSYAVVVGCGGLGCTIATALVRAGVGRVRVIDRDIVEYHNLHRQLLYDEGDVRQELPKAIAAEKHLKKINSEVNVEGVVADVNYSNAEKLVSGADIILDGLDNPETRFTINDAALKLNIPWIYGSAVQACGRMMTIIPGKTACLRCVSTTVLPRGVIPTCDVAGVVGPVVFTIGSIQATEAMKVMLGDASINPDMLMLDLWENSFNRFKVERRADCPACRGSYEFLKPEKGIRVTTLCSQNAVQVQDPAVATVSLIQVATNLKKLGTVKQAENALHFTANNYQMVIFPDGRMLLRNSLDESLARELYMTHIIDKRRGPHGKSR